MRVLFAVLRCTVCVLLIFNASHVLASAQADWPPMSKARTEISVALLDDSAVVAGGIGFFWTSKRCERLLLSEKRWVDCPDLPRRLHHVALAGYQNRAYAAGGYVSLGFRHDAEPGLWSLGADDKQWRFEADLPTPVGEHALMAKDGYLYLVGGRTPAGDSAALWRYSLTDKTWKALAPMPVARNSFAAVWYGDDLLVVGGRSYALGPGIALMTRYIVAEDRWQQEPSIPVGRGGHSAAVVNDVLHVFGGELFGPDRLIDRHDSWTPVDGWQEHTPLPVQRHGTAAFAYQGKAFILGGATRASRPSVYSMTGLLEVWSPANEQ